MGAWAGAGSGVPLSRALATTSPLAGGGDLSTDRTFYITPGSNGQYLTTASGVVAWGSVPRLDSGITLAYTSVNIGAGRYPVAVGVQTGGASGTTTASSAYHLFLPASTTWRLEMITSYVYGGGGTMRGSVRTASAWGGTYAESAFVTTTNGGINTVYTVDYIVGGSARVGIFECYHASNGINNVILRFFQVG